MTTLPPVALAQGPDDPWVLHLVARVERPPAGPPAGGAVLALAARTVLALLADERAAAEGPWAEAIAAWEGVSIRKVARRARGAAWARAAALDGVLLEDPDPGSNRTDGGPDEGAGPVGVLPAAVIALPPTPRSATPREIDVLQVGGTDLAPAPPLQHVVTGPPAHMVLVLAPVPMTTGKAMAQVGHAAQLVQRRLDGSAEGAAWAAAGWPVVVATADAGGWQRVVRRAVVLVHDAGHTEVAPGTATVAALRWADALAASPGG